MLAQRRDRRRIVAIQTKTASPGTAAFRLGLKDEDPGERDNEWYALVALSGLLERPKFYIVPRHVIAALAYLEHLEWMDSLGRLRKPAKAGVKRNENPMRDIYPHWIEGYVERWDLLDASAWEAPFLGTPVFLELARDIPLPANYHSLNPSSTSR